MIQKVEMYQAVCDGCGLIHYDNVLKTSKFKNKSEALGSAIYDEWCEISGHIYCPDCVEYDKETDSTNLRKQKHTTNENKSI